MKHFGVREREGECGGRVDVSGFLREELLVCAETARCVTAVPP